MRLTYLLVTVTLIAPLVASADAPTTQQYWSAERRLQISARNKDSLVHTLENFEETKSELADLVTHSDLHNLLAGCDLREFEVKINVDVASKTVDLLVTSADSQADANQKANRLAQAFMDKFTSASEATDAEIHAEQEQQQIIESEIEELKDRYQQGKAQLRKQTGTVDVSPASVRERMASLQTQKESATIELAAKQARSDALALQISKFSGQIQDKVKNDPIAAELAKVVDARQKEFDRVQENSKAGAVTQSEVDQAMAGLAEAKAKLLERQEAAANAAGGDIVSNWNRELMTLSVDIAELQARSKALDDRLATYANADNYLDNADQWIAESANLEKSLSTIQEKVDHDGAEYRRNLISIEVIKTPSSPATKP